MMMGSCSMYRNMQYFVLCFFELDEVQSGSGENAKKSFIRDISGRL
jgi:hypothetical protein